MDAARRDVHRKGATGRSAALARWPRVLVACMLAAAFVLPAAGALAQDSSGGGVPMPKFILGGEHKRKLTPEEEERQEKIDADYKAATKKIPDQKAADPWGDVRQAPAGQKASTSTQNASAQKKKQPGQQAQ